MLKILVGDLIKFNRKPSRSYWTTEEMDYGTNLIEAEENDLMLVLNQSTIDPGVFEVLVAYLGRSAFVRLVLSPPDKYAPNIDVLNR